MNTTVSQNEQERINWVAGQLKLIPEGAELLDAGAGEQQYRKFCTHLNYTSQDFAQYDPTSVEKGLQMGKWEYGKLDIVSDIASIPRSDKTFDAILCTEVLEHIPDPIAALREFSRLLKPGGTLLLTAPFCSMTHFAPYHYSTGFSKYYYEYHLPLLGFAIRELKPNGNYFSYLMQEVSRAPFVAETYGYKIPGKVKLWALKLVNDMLRKFANDDSKSSELMCFGWHVKAIRN